MKKIVNFLTMALVAGAFFFSCATVPVPESEQKQTQQLKMKIEKRGYQTYAPDDYKAGETQAAQGDAALEKKDNQTAKKAYDGAIDSYKTVIKKAIAARSKKSRTEVDSAKTEADSLKAGVAVKDEYGKAEDLYAKGKAAEQAGDTESAVDYFDEASTIYVEATKTAQIKKTKAVDNLDSSKKSMDEAQKNAQDAQKLIDEQNKSQ